MSTRLLTLVALFAFSSTAGAQSNTFFVSSNVNTGQLWHAATDAGNGTSGSCSPSSNSVQYYSTPFFTDTRASTYSLHLYYESFQSGFVYLYQDAFNPQDPCTGIFVFGYAPLANIYDITLEANRQYVFVTSEDTLYGGGGSFQVTIEGPGGSHLFPGEAPSTHVPFCAGDGSATACPCGNESPSGSNEGCLNSLGQGGKLTGSGHSSVSSDSLVLTGSQMPDGSTLYVQGSASLNGGNGVLFGDGLRCTGGASVRLGFKANTGGSSRYPASGDPPVSVRGGIPLQGGTFVYQAWYRNPAGFCTPATFNATNALRVTWAP